MLDNGGDGKSPVKRFDESCARWSPSCNVSVYLSGYRTQPQGQ